MNRPLAQVEQKLQNMEYENRYTRSYAQHLLVFLPVVLYAAVSYWDLGRASLVALGAGGLASVLVVVFLHVQVRARTLDTLRREGVIGEDYQPPSF